MLEERRRTRLAAKELRIQQQQKKVAEREETQIARAAEKQLRQDIQLSKRGNRRSRKPPPPTIDVAEEPKAVVADLQSIADEVPVSGPATRTRNIRLPQRYRM